MLKGQSSDYNIIGFSPLLGSIVQKVQERERFGGNDTSEIILGQTQATAALSKLIIKEYM